MPTFDTPAPISVSVDIGAGNIEIIASDRADTVVEVRPANPTKKVDVDAVEQTKVNYSDGALTVKAPKNWRQYVVWGGGGSVDIKIELPSGSRLRGEVGVGLALVGPTGGSELRGTGILGECTFKIGVGDIRISQAGPLQLRTGAGDITVERAVGQSEITTGSGGVHVSRLEGAAVLKNSNGDIWVGEAGADLRVTTANGKISVALARSDVEAKTANGSVQIDEVMGGTVRAQTAMGKVEVGVRRGVAALLDLETSFGKVLNGLDASGPPEPGQPSVEVQARTSFGDIRIFRASGPDDVDSAATTRVGDNG
jgi:Putative adhesin